jgi:hypothetical protein
VIRLRIITVFLLAPLAAAATNSSGAELVVSSDFAGGSAKVVAIDQARRSIEVRPADHPERGWACWWYLKLSGMTPGETISLTVGEAPWATPDRATYSLDGCTWKQTPLGRRDGARVIYTHKAEAAETLFAWGPPFLPSDGQELVDETAKKSPHAKVIELCRTLGDRPVPALVVRQANPEIDAKDAKEHRRGIWIQARQHAWESGSSWVCRGLVAWLVSDDPRAESLRKHSQITIVPIMDVDNVLIGAGGKEEKPHDHNRDWSDTPHFPAVREAMKRIKEMDAAGRFDLFVDLHNPDAGTQEPFFYITPRELLADQGRASLDQFLACARMDMTGPLAFAGQTRESGPNYDKLWRNISKNWVSTHTREHVVALTLETPWNTPQSTVDGYRAVGAQLGLSIERYFRKQDATAE